MAKDLTPTAAGMTELPAGIIFYPDTRPGIARRRCGRGFSYTLPDGTTLSRGPERKRVEALGIPPAYEAVWICPRRNGHLQATGLDAAQRKQYRYHEDWTEARSREKFDRLLAFGHALPRLRRNVSRDLAEEEVGDQRFALAAALLLIDKLSLRVGNAAYTKQNGSYGALTLRRRHLKLTEAGLNLSFTAKGGKKVRRRLTDRKVMEVLEAARDLPGAELLTWIDDQGQPHSLSSSTLNDYIAEQSGVEATAKTFRTWAGSLAAFDAVEHGETTIKALSQAAAHRLNNTPTVARNSYIHPEIIALVETGAPERTTARKSGLSACEARMLAFLEQQAPASATKP